MNVAIILAGGVGSRMGAGKPKQFIEINGKPIIAHAIEKFQKHEEIDKIIIVSVDVEAVRKIVSEYNFDKVSCIVSGGKTRYYSSKIGCETAKELGAGPNDIVLIHDAARPFVSDEIISENIRAAKEFGACETALKVNDTMIRAEGGCMDCVVPRENLYRVQTPQSFKLGVILDAHKQMEELSDEETEKITDDAMMVNASGRKVKIVNGSNENIKITTKEDLVNFS